MILQLRRLSFHGVMLHCSLGEGEQSRLNSARDQSRGGDVVTTERDSIDSRRRSLRVIVGGVLGNDESTWRSAKP